MSESWQPEDSEIWHTHPSESSHPSFPFADHSADPFWQPLSASESIPPPPPPPVNAISQDDKPTAPMIGATLGMGIGVIVGALFAFVAVLALGYVLLNNALGLGTHTHASTTSSTSIASGGGTTDGIPGNSAGGSSATPGNQGGAGGSNPGVTATNGATPAPGTTPINVATPGASMTATTVAINSTMPPATATSTPAPLPLTVAASSQDHKSVSMNIQTMAGTALVITVTYCNGSTDSKYNNFATVTASGSYNDTMYSVPKCPGNQAEGTVMVKAHLNGYLNASAMATTQGG